MEAQSGRHIKEELKQTIENLAENYTPYPETEIRYDTKLVRESNLVIYSMEKHKKYYYPAKILEYLYLSYPPRYIQKIIDNTNSGHLKYIMGTMTEEGRIHIYKRMSASTADQIASFILNETQPEDGLIYKAAVGCMDDMVELFDAPHPQITPPYKEGYPMCGAAFAIFAENFRRGKLPIFIRQMEKIIDNVNNGDI